MPSFKELATVTTVWVMFAFATGHRQWVYDSIGYLRQHAIQESRKSWGCPSIFDSHACHSWSYGNK